MAIRIKIQHTFISNNEIVFQPDVVVRQSGKEAEEIAEKENRSLEVATFVKYIREKREEYPGHEFEGQNAYNAVFSQNGNKVFVAFESDNVAQHPGTGCLLNNLERNSWLTIPAPVDDDEEDIY